MKKSFQQQQHNFEKYNLQNRKNNQTSNNIVEMYRMWKHLNPEINQNLQPNPVDNDAEIGSKVGDLFIKKFRAYVPPKLVDFQEPKTNKMKNSRLPVSENYAPTSFSPPRDPYTENFEANRKISNSKNSDQPLWKLMDFSSKPKPAGYVSSNAQIAPAVLLRNQKTLDNHHPHPRHQVTRF